jgi:hypothetical protein
MPTDLDINLARSWLTVTLTNADSAVEDIRAFCNGLAGRGISSTT